MSVDDAFAKVVGRQATEPERERLYRLRDALGLHDNDAFWSIVMALEHYDSFFRAYPGALAEEMRRTIESARAAFAAAAEHEAVLVHRMLSEKVAETSVEIARKLVDKPWALHRVTMVLAGLVLFGAFCASGGYLLAAGERPFWVARSGLSGTGRVLATVLAAPAGWMVFLFLTPAAVLGIRLGWKLGADTMADGREKVIGWCIVAACVVGCVACAVMLVRVI